MNLPQAPKAYDQSDQDRTRDQIRQELEKSFKRGQTVEIGMGRLVLTDSVTGDRYDVTIASGVLTLTVVTI